MHYTYRIITCLIPLFLGLSASGHESRAHRSTFTILSYNVQMRPMLDWNDFKAERIGPRLSTYDIACLQENFAREITTSSHTSKRTFNRRKSFYHPLGSGLATFSHFPIESTAEEHYESSARTDSLASKGVLLTRFNVNGAILDVYNTHLQAGDTDKDHAARSDQAEQLVKFVMKHSPATHSILIVGDFNMGPVQPGKIFEGWSHYSSEKDREIRTHTYQKMFDRLGLTDVRKVLGLELDEINQITFRSGHGYKLTPTELRKDDAKFLDEYNESLSDSSPEVVTFTLQKTHHH